MGERTSMVTLLFTDLVASTQLLARLGDDAAEEVRRTHFSVLRRAIADHGGDEVKSLGDGLMVAFSSVVDALHCAVAIQQGIEASNAEPGRSNLSVRVGVHAGEPLRDGEDFHGEAVVVASRLCNDAEGGQILTSEVVAGLVGSRGQFRFRPVGRLRLKGLPDLVAAVSVEWRAPDRPAPARAEQGGTTGPQAARGPLLVGRAQQLIVLEDELERAAAGQFRAALLVGEGGVGKTRLAAELAARHAAEVTSLAARAYPLGATTAFGVWIEALERHLRGLDPWDVERLCAGSLDELSGLLRSVRAARGSADGPWDEPPRSRVLEALTVLLSNLAASRPLVVQLDDVHLADASSLELLHYLAYGCADAPLLVVATTRPAELAERREAAEVLARLEQDGLVRRLTVEPLDSAGLGGLAEAVTGQPTPPGLVDWVEKRSRGNPLYAIGLLRALIEEGADLTAPVLRRLPENLAERVTARLRELDASALKAVELLAVFGRRVESRSLMGLWGEGPDDLTETLERLVQAKGVIEDERGHELTYEISHPLTAEAVYQSIGAGRRRRLHREVGRALLATGRLGEAAQHFARSADPGDDEAVGVLRDAVRQAENAGSYQEALTILGTLVELLPAGDPRWADVVDALSWDAEWVVNHRADTHALLGIPALRAMDRALEGLGAHPRRAAVKLRLANFLAWGTGDVEEAARICHDAQRLFEDFGDQRGKLLARHERAWIDYFRGSLPACNQAAAEVAREAEMIGDRMVRGRALSTILGVTVLQGEVPPTVAAECRDLARAEGNHHRLRLTLSYLGFAAALRGQSTEARAAVAECDAITAMMSESGPGLEFETVVCWLAGDYRAALARARRHGIVSGQLSRQRAFAVAAAALAASEMAELTEARRYVIPAREVYGDRHWGLQSDMARYAEAMLDWRQSRAPKAVEALKGVVARGLAMEAWAVTTPALVDVAEINGRLGRADSTAFDGLNIVAERTGLGCHRALGELAAAWGSFGAGNGAATVAQAGRAIELLSEVSWPIFLGRAKALCGLATTDRAQAVDLLRAAAEIFDDCGAIVRRLEALDALTRLGSAGKRAAAAAAGPESLTRRERDVAALAATGLSAKEIGKRLFIGERTVEGHLARAYTKLGVRSKMELTERADELGLLWGP